MNANCKNCIKVEKEILILADKYNKVVEYSMRRKDIKDLDRELAEVQILKLFREGGVFSYQTIDKPHALYQGMSQTIDLKAAIEILQALRHKYADK